MAILGKGYPLCQEMPGIVDCPAKMFPIKVAVIIKFLCNVNASFSLCVKQNPLSHVFFQELYPEQLKILLMSCKYFALRLSQGTTLDTINPVQIVALTF